MIRMFKVSPLPGPSFTPKQGQYLAFIYAYTRVLGPAPCRSQTPAALQSEPPFRPSDGANSRKSRVDPTTTRGRSQH